MLNSFLISFDPQNCRFSSFLLLAAVVPTTLLVPTTEAFQVTPLAPPPLCCSTMTLHLASTADIHPAVEGWPEKYRHGGNNADLPRPLHNDFTIVKASDIALEQLNVRQWPTWTTSDKDKWAVGNQNADKIMPYNELSYVLEGKLEIVPAATGVAEIVDVGQFVTFPEGFQASWRVLEELTWHYYLY